MVDEKNARIVKLIFSESLIKEPLVFKMAVKHNVVPNIRRARVTSTLGEIVLDLEGRAEDIEKGLAYLEENGVEVKSSDGDLSG